MDTNTVNDKRTLLPSTLLFKLFTFFVLSFFAPKVFAQLDYIHYVPPLYNGSNTNKDIGRNVVVITTDSRELIDVWIYKGDNNLLAQIQVSRFEPYRYVFETSRADNYGYINSYPTDYEFPIGVVGANELNTVLDDAGLKFISYDAPIYVNMRHITQDQGGSLTTKGRFAMGKEFRTGHVYTANVGATFRRAHFFSVMATEDNTTVKFTDIKTEVLTQLIAGSIEPFAISALDTITVLLQKGQSYVIGIDHDIKGFGTGNMNALNGTHILSDKDIVVNTGSWTSGSSAGQDMGIDQIVPYEQIRDKYIVLKGEGNSSTEVPIVVPTEDGTDIYLNGSSTPINSFPLNAGEPFLVTTGNYYNDKMYIDTKGKNVYVYQTLSGSSSKIGPTVGMNFIAPLSATGMHQVDIPFADQLAIESVNSVITILAQKGATVKYENIIDGVTTEREFLPSEASTILGTEEWVSYRMDAVVGNIRFQSSRALNVCWTVQTGVVGSAGYYSGFSKAIPKIIPDLHVDLETDLSVICESYNDNIVVDFVSIPDPDFYEWYRNEVTPDSLIFENEKLNELAPDVPTKYILKAYYRDPTLDILYNGDFSSGRGNFETDYEEVSGNLRYPGQFALTFSPQSENSSFVDFDDMEGGGLMFLAMSGGVPGDTVYQKLDIPIERNSNYIIKVHGRMAQASPEVAPQSLDVYINDERVKSNFLIDDASKWKSTSALWKSMDNQKATISLIDANASGNIGVFAIDSITFVPAVQDSAEFNALVIPNYSFTPYNKPQHFCLGQLSGNIDISNGDTSWYTYVWERKIGENDYIPIAETNVSGTDSYNLVFNNITNDNAGIYRCSINFKEEYQQCGMALKPAQVEVEVVVDELAQILSLTEGSDLCEGEFEALEVNVEGEYSRIAWSVNGVEKAEGKVFNFNQDKVYGAGIYTIRCDVENACQPLSREIEIEIFGKPYLTDLQVPTNLCDQESVNLTAVCSVPADASMEYSWYRDNNLIETNNLSVFSIIPDMSDAYYKVAVAARYNIGGLDEHTCVGNELVSNLAADAVYPQVVLTALEPVTLCEGLSYLYKTELETSGDYYTYNWEVPVGVSGDTDNADFSLSNITPDMVGDYKVTVSNRCGTANTTSLLTVTPKMEARDITIDNVGPYCDGSSVTITVDADDANHYMAENITVGQKQTINPILSPFVLNANSANEGVWEITAVGDCGTSYQEPFTIELLEDFSNPTINDITTCYGVDVSFEVQIETIPSGSELTYIWTVPVGAPVVDSGTAILYVSDVQADDLGVYTCEIENKCGNKKIVTATLSIESVTSALTAPDVEVCQGTSDYSFNIDYVGTPTFEWRYNTTIGDPLSTLDHYTIPTVEKGNEGIYYCDITLACGSFLRYQRKLVVNDHIAVTSDPSVILDICEGEQTELIINVTGTPNSIKWFDDSGAELVAYEGKTRISTGILNSFGTYNYKCKLTGDCENPEANFAVTVHDKPSINPIADINTCAGDVALSMIVVGTDFVQESWLNPDNSLLANGLTTTITGATYPTSSGNYTAKVTTAYCGDVSTVAKVNVFKPIGILSNSDIAPKPCIGKSLSLVVNGEGDGLSYKWTKEGVDQGVQPIPNILDLGAADLTDNGAYKCELISANGCTGDQVDFTVDVREHAKITLQPLAQTPCEGDASATFTVGGTAEDTPYYKWYNNNVLISDGGDYAGATTTDLTVSNLLGHDTELFHCEISGDFCASVESDKVSLDVKQNITIANHPVDITIDENGSATFTVTATGGEPITYQWYENGVSMGATPASARTASLTLTNVPLSYNGNTYYCKVSNACDVKDSNPAALTVNLDNRITAQGVNTESCDGSSFAFTVQYKNTTTSCTWEYDDGYGYTDASGLGSVVSGGTSSTLTVTAATMAMNTWKFRALIKRTGYVDNVSNDLEVKVYQQVVFDDIIDATLCPNSGESFNVNTTAGTGPYTYEWKRGSTILGAASSLILNSIAAIDGAYTVEVTNGVCTPVTDGFNISHHPDLVLTDIAHASPLCIGDDINLSAVLTEGPAPGVTYTWAKDGADLLEPGNTYSKLNVTTGESGIYKVIVEDICTLKTSSLAINVLDAISLAAISPTVSSQCEGEPLDLQVDGTGDNLVYNWYKIDALGGAIIGGSLSSDKVLHLDALTTVGANYYRCVLSSILDCNQPVQEFTVNVQEDIVVVDPAPITICEDLLTSNFSVTATGEGPLTYQWYDNDIAMGSETGAGLSVDNVIANNGHNYHCVVNGTCKSDESEKALFTVNENVTITTQPVSVSVSDLATDPVYFSVDAIGTGLTYQWWKNGVSMDNTPVSAQTKTLEVLSADFVSGDNYYCVVSGTCVDETSNTVSLTISVTDKITSQPRNIEICENLSFDFEVKYKSVATGVWWYDDDNDNIYDPIPASVGTVTVSDDLTYKTNVLTVKDSDPIMNNWKFKLIIDGGPEESSVVKVKVYEQVAFDDITDVTLCPNTGKNLNVNITDGTGPYTYDWKRGAASLGAASSINLNAAAAIDGAYSVEVSNGVCNPVSDGFTISHHPDLVLTDIAHASPLCLGDDINLSTVLTEGPAPGVTYTWTKDGTDLLEPSDIYSKLNVTTAESGIYKVVVADMCTSKSSSTPINVVDAISLAAVSPVIQSICEGEPLDLQVEGTGDNLVYTWYRIDALGGAIVGGSLSSDKDYHIAALTTIGANYYRCVLSSTPDCIQPLQEFTVNVLEDVAVSDPLQIVICEDLAKSSFSVAASGEGPLTYQWYNNAGSMLGETGASIDVDNILTNSGQNYYCIVSGTCKSAESDKALFTVNENVTITNHPDDITIDEMGSATFTVDATGTGLTYQWYENGVSMGSSPVSAQTKTLNLTSVPFANNGYEYYCKVTGTCSFEDSAPATVTIIKESRILVHAESTDVCEGNPFIFRVDYKNTTDGCDWEYDDNNDGVYDPIGGLGIINNQSTYSELTITTATDAMNLWKFRAIVKRPGFDDNESNVVSVRVDKPANFAQIDDIQICNGRAASFSVSSLTGSTPYTYQWSEGVRNLGTSSSLNLIAADATDGTYTVEVTAGVCPATVKTFSISHYPDLALSDLIHATELCPTDNINLNVIINSGPAQAASYSWTKDDVDLGATTDSYNKLNVTDSERGLYKVTVEDYCMTQSKSIKIDVLDIITKVSADWIDQTLCVGDDLLLDASVTGDGATYVWTVPAGVVAPVNVPVLNLNSITETNEGTYTCVVSGSCGTSVTYTANILVNDVPNITAGIETLAGVCENEALVLGPITYDATTGESILWKFNDGVIAGETSESLNLANADLADEGNYRVEVTNACGTDFSLGFQDVHPIPTLAPIDNQTACQGENVIFRAVTTGENLTYRWFINDVARPEYDDQSEIEILNIQPFDVNTPQNHKIECQVSSCSTDLDETAYVLVNPNTILSKSIKGEVVYVGSPHVFDLDVTGSNLTFEWHHVHTDGADEILPETTKTLTIGNLSLADAGEYSCKISGDCGVRFTSGYLTVKDPLRIVEGLGGDAIEKCFGEPLNLNISVEGEVFSINWFKGADDLNHHELNFSIPALDVSDAGFYRCEIVGEGANIKDTVNVVVYQTTVLNSDLKDEVLCENDDLLWTPAVSGSFLTYGWKHNGKIVSTDPALSILNTPMDSAGIYAVDITGKCGSVSTEANLTLKKLPYFVSKSDDLEKCENDTEAIFSVNYGGDNLLYQWQKDDVDIEGANSSELKIQNLRTSDAGVYKCVVSSSCGFAPEAPVQNLVVIPQLKILSESPGMEICDGEEAQFIVEVEGTDEVYQWQKNGIAIPGENAPQLAIGSASLNEEGYYSCEVSDKCTARRYSNSKKLTVNELPNSQIFGRMTLCVLEDRVAYNTAIQPDINYGWLVEGGEFTSPSEGFKTKITWGDVIEDGKVKLKILNEATGCYFEVDSLVTLHPLPVVTLASQESRGICNSEFELGGGLPVGGIYWVNGVAQNTFDPSQGNGEYQVRYSYTDDLGCSNTTDETLMTIDSLPVVKLIEDVVVGSCGSKELSAVTEENNIKWSPSRYLDDPNSLTPTFTSGETTLYVATVVDKHECVGNDIVNVTVASLPLITTINDTIIGECKEIELTTHISGDIDEITWSNAGDLDNSKSSNPKLIKPHVGVNDYQISVTDKYGCLGSASIKVEVLPNPEIGENQFLCEGETLVVDIKDLSNPIWKDGYTAWERIIDKPGEYELSVEENDCELKQKIVMNPSPKFELDNNDVYPGIVIFEGETYTLAPDLDPDYGPYTYTWSDSSVLPELVVVESGTYKLKVEDNIGCVATDTVVVEVKPIGIESPNAFTPLSKNENDRFYLKDINVTDRFEMYIYNRWGELLYKTNEAGYANGWDGTYKGEDCPVGAYVWVLMLDGKVKEKGNVILVR